MVLSAPSGAGKTTVTKKLLKRRDDLGYSVSCTTRAPRAGEMNGVDYHFLSEDDFAARRDRGEFAEWAVVHGRMYGTLKSAVEKVFDGKQHVIMDIDVQGAEQFVAAYADAVLVFLFAVGRCARVTVEGEADRKRSATAGAPRKCPSRVAAGKQVSLCRRQRRSQ